MYQFDSGYHQGFELALPESQVVILPLQQDTPNSEPTILGEQPLNLIKPFPKDSEVCNDQLTKPACEQQLEQLISNLLKYGVILSSVIVLVGGILYLMNHGAEPVNYQIFQGEPAEFCSPKGVLTAVLSGRRRGIIQLGLLVLIATPIIRVIISFLTFLRYRDLTYMVITGLVLISLLYSLIGAYV